MIDLWTVWVVVVAFAFGRSMLVWGFLTYTLGWWILLPLCIFGPRAKTWERRAAYVEKLNEWSEKHLSKKEPKDFDNVHDLFQQIEKK